MELSEEGSVHYDSESDISEEDVQENISDTESEQECSDEECKDLFTDDFFVKIKLPCGEKYIFQKLKD